MALGALGVAALGTAAGTSVGNAIVGQKDTNLLTTKQNTTTSFLDPTQLQRLLTGLSQAEGQARGDISTGIQSALGVLTGDTNYAARESAIRNQAIQNKLQSRAGDEDVDTYLERIFRTQMQGDRSDTSQANTINYLKRQGKYDQYLDNFKQKYIDQLNISDADLSSAEGILRSTNSELFSTIGGTDQVDPYLRSTQALNLNALNQMAAMSGIAGSDGQVAMSPEQIQANLEATPGYQFRLDQGLQGVERAGSARGLLESGAILKGLTEFGQGLASQEFGAEHARLATLAGQTANASLTGASQQQQNTMAQAELLAGQGSQLANISTQAAQQRGNALLQGGTNTQITNQNELFRGLNRI